jgi:hypothetical protein
MIRFYKTQAQLTDFCSKLKLTLCPHCNLSGSLILHGYLYGYSEHGHSQRIIRGRRIFCSNRNNKCGCGRTFSILAAGFLPGFVIGAQSLWRFFDHIKNGAGRACAFRDAGLSMAQTSIYRLFKKLTLNQVRIRTFLARINAPPQAPHVQNPVILTILHLCRVFAGAACPIAEFQHHFQAPFF